LRLYYEKIFQNLQQTNCRIIAKAYIKLVEPRKQVNYPYNGRKIVEGRTQQLDPEATKPPWWPQGVSHREPDHLPKVGKRERNPSECSYQANNLERIRLLVHMLCEMRETHGITTARLKQSDQPIRRQILPVERLQILDEAYRVREEEENYLDGISGTYLLMLSSTPFGNSHVLSRWKTRVYSSHKSPSNGRRYHQRTKLTNRTSLFSTYRRIRVQ
jgi:hypothetical protein